MKKLLNKLAKFSEIIGFTLFMVLLGLIVITNPDFRLIWILGGIGVICYWICTTSIR